MRIKNTIRRALKVLSLSLGIGMLSSLFPFGTLGLVFGFPSVIVNSIFITLAYFYFEEVQEDASPR
jgi:hypothetical protein